MRRSIGRFERAIRGSAAGGFERVHFEPPALGTDVITVQKDGSQYRTSAEKAAFSGRMLRNVT